MVRIFFLAAGLSCLGACTSWPATGGAGPAWHTTGSAARGFRFDWRLSGDPAVAPMQVFDDGNEVWLHFAPGQALPAIFGMREGLEHPLPYTRREPYAVVAGSWGALRFRGGRLSARAERDVDASVMASASAPASVSASTSASALPDATPSVAIPPSGVGELAARGPMGSAGGAPATAAATALDTAAGVTTTHSVPAMAASLSGDASAPARFYRAAPPDTTLRAVLARWAGDSGWTFYPRHWAVDVDIPLSASAEFSGDFKSAVRELLSATELGDKPLQPCFYGNQVLRVVPLAQSCSRAAVMQGGGA
ncbi:MULTISPECIES: TcpQ domain-containing protein [Achromobacter]|uniref:TcpQ domain-containing protein n=1 Tax=Achromobacter spanius TaxID=217203 RepID=A0ABY8GUE6_9BURK|nr:MULTISPECIES: TcpQ domain-containing protein [Achromobacter]WAI82413.1 TcpQ domain-containing protein [Achromobacter spanius]WEX92500.1 TcpQ domain-containing protein [Achromobacter sp. SS2-2022]WFP08347.1 TcpQ domain-containing protein [Achromobacter spanius]